MKILLDANVLVSVLNEEYPVYGYSARILSLAGSARFRLYSTPLSLAIAFYFAGKKNRATAKQRVGAMALHLQIAEMNAKVVEHAVRDKRAHDFEDGLQYYSALESGCKVIVTEDGGDFYFSELEVMNSREFMERYVF